MFRRILTALVIVVAGFTAPACTCSPDPIITACS